MLNHDPMTGLIVVLSIMAYFGGMALWTVFVVGSGPPPRTSDAQLYGLIIFWPLFAVLGSIVVAIIWIMDRFKRKPPS